MIESRVQKKTFRFSKENIHKTFIVLLLSYLFIAKLLPIMTLPSLGDEQDDWWFSFHLFDFFNYLKISYDSENARFPHLLSLPLILIFKHKALISLRILFLIFHTLYLFVFYKTLRLKFPKTMSIYCIFLVGFSTYLFSFSIFTMTTSNNLFLLTSMCFFYYYLKNFDHTDQYEYKKVLILSSLIALMIASRLTGVFYLFTIVILNLYKNRKHIFSLNHFRILIRQKITILNIAFTSLVLTYSFFFRTNSGTTFLLAASFLYFVIFSWFIFIQKRSLKIHGGLILWLHILHLAFNLTLVFSPIYLNYNNFLPIFNWLERSNNPDLHIYPSPFDVVSFFWVKGIDFLIYPLIFSLLSLIYFKKVKQFNEKAFLFLIIFMIHFFIISISKFFMVYYPLPIFPFIYIPIAALTSKIEKIISLPLKTLAMIALVSIPIFEHWRYWNLYPYGHIQGYEKGEKYIGWSKPGFITFEAFPSIFSYFEKNQIQFQKNHEKKIYFDGWSSKEFNGWATSLLNQHFKFNGNEQIKFIDSNKNPSKKRPYYLTTNYTNKDHFKFFKTHYLKIHESKIKDLTIATLWKLNASKK